MAERKRESMSGVDTAWLRMEHPTNLMMITTVMTFDEPIAYDDLRDTLERSFLRFDRFRQRVTHIDAAAGAPQWEDDPHFDIRSHLHQVALPAPGDQIVLQRFVSDLMSSPLDFSKPLWQIHLVENFNGGCALVWRIHHCIADGIALVHVMLSMTTTSPDEPLHELDPASPRRSRPFDPVIRPAAAAVNTTIKTTETLWHEGMEVLTNPAHVLDLVQAGAGGAAALGKLLMMGPDPKTIFKGRLGTQKSAAWSQPIPLDEIKAVGRFTHGTINDILLTAVAGSLRRYLESRGETVDGVSIRAVVPVNLRPLTETPRLGNRFGLIFLDLPVGLPDPLDRLIKLQEAMDTIKSSPEALVAFGILNVMGTMPDEVEKLIVGMFGTKATSVMTNVPGPRYPVYLAGRQVRTVMFWVPQSGRLGLGVSIISYDSQVWLGIATDTGLVPDPDTIIAGFHEELNMFCEMVRHADPARRHHLAAGEEQVPASYSTEQND